MTKLEEIALAIHRARYPDAPVMDGIEGLGPTVAVQALVEARATVEALRKPTGAMIDAGKPWAVGDAAPNCWVRMIDAILNEKPGA